MNRPVIGPVRELRIVSPYLPGVGGLERCVRSSSVQLDQGNPCDVGTRHKGNALVRTGLGSTWRAWAVPWQTEITINDIERAAVRMVCYRSRLEQPRIVESTMFSSICRRASSLRGTIFALRPAGETAQSAHPNKRRGLWAFSWHPAKHYASRSSRKSPSISGLFLTAILCALPLERGFAADEDAGAKLRAELSDLTEINIHPGLNEVDLFAVPGVQSPEPDALIFGKSVNAPFHHKGKILKLLSEISQSQDSHYFYTIAIDGIHDYSDEWLIIQRDQFNGNEGGGDFFTDETSRTGYFWEKIRFFNGNVSGKKSTVIVITRQEASRYWEANIPSPIQIGVFQLQTASVHFPAIFSDIAEITIHKKYCDSDLALWNEMKVPLPKGYTSDQSKDGC